MRIFKPMFKWMTQNATGSFVLYNKSSEVWFFFFFFLRSILKFKSLFIGNLFKPHFHLHIFQQVSYTNCFYNFYGTFCHLWSLTAEVYRKSSMNIQLNISTSSSTEERKSYWFGNKGEHMKTDFFWKLFLKGISF